MSARAELLHPLLGVRELPPVVVGESPPVSVGDNLDLVVDRPDLREVVDRPDLREAGDRPDLRQVGHWDLPGRGQRQEQELRGRKRGGLDEEK